jgi:hypothetical protein
MARRRAAFNSLFLVLRSDALDSSDSSGSLHDGQRLANPGLPGFNSNSSPQTAQTLIGKDMVLLWYRRREIIASGRDLELPRAE